MTNEDKKAKQREYMREYRARLKRENGGKGPGNYRKAVDNIWEVWEPGSIANMRAPRPIAAITNCSKEEAEAYIATAFPDGYWIDIDPTREFEAHVEAGKVPLITLGERDDNTSVHKED